MANDETRKVLDDRPVLLVVEGKEDEIFFRALVKHLDLTQMVQVLEIGGRSNLTRQLNLLKSSREFLDNVKSVGIVRDADEDARTAFQSVCSGLRNVGLPVPKKPLKVALGNPATAVMIVPPTTQRGMLEDVCLQSMSDDPLMACVDSFIACAKISPESTNVAKARVQVLLAAKEPELRVGEAAQKAIWNWEHPAFAPLSDFLKQLIEKL